MYALLQNSRIYVACPASNATGGTEALCSLYSIIRGMGYDAYIYYFNATSGILPIPERFKKFDIKYVTELDDSQSITLIIPETAPFLSRKYKRAKKIIWWLSVDNYYACLRCQYPPPDLYQKFRIFRRQRKYGIDFADGSMLHLAQSHYAMSFLENLRVKNRAFLSDSLSEDFLQAEVDLTDSARQNAVLYNPKKGLQFTKDIMASAPDITFMALENMTPAQVAALCSQSKIYIDFGNHPGKDRFPRESALRGNIVITGRRGAALFSEDVPIPETYKFDDTKNVIPAIIKKIRECFSGYNERIKDFDAYRESIKRESRRFSDDVMKIFPKLR